MIDVEDVEPIDRAAGFDPLTARAQAFEVTLEGLSEDARRTFDTLGPALAAQGYEPVPIRPGEKRPVPNNWTAGGFAADADRYARAYTGILTRDCPAVDIDVSDPELVRQVEAIVLDVLDCHESPPPARVGLPPRRLLVFRTHEPFEKLQTAEYELRTDAIINGKWKRSKVEILANGQQFVAFAVHPDTRKPYYWNGGGNPLTVSRDKLVPLDWAQAVEIIRRCDELLAQHGQRIGAARITNNTGTREANEKLQADDPDVLRQALEAIPNDELHFDDWISMLYATKAALGDEGLSAFMAWSAKSSTKHDEPTTRREWAKARPNRRGAGSIYWLAEKHGWVPPWRPSIGSASDVARAEQRKRAQAIGDGSDDAPPLAEVLTVDDMLGALVFISDGARVARRDRPHLSLPLSEFKLHTKASRVEAGGKTIPAADAWVGSRDRITVHTVTFRPGAPEFTTDPEGARSLNLWIPRERAPSSMSVAPFLDHVDYLVPDPAERERFLSWLAHIEQHPGVLPHTHYLMVTPQTGIGRNWLASLLARVWSGATRLGFDLVGAMNSGFNGPLSRRLLVIVDELKAADTGYSAANHAQQLKAMLTTEHRIINPKFGRQHVEFNCARWLMLSQHFDALPLERADRRVVVITNPTERRPVEYYRHLYSLLECPEFIDAVAFWLARRDLTGFNPSEPAPLTDAKRKAIEASMSDIELALIALRNGTTARLMTTTDIGEYLADCGLRPPTGRALSVAYAAVGMVPCDRLVMHRGKRQRVVALRDGERLRSASSTYLTAELAKSLRGE